MKKLAAMISLGCAKNLVDSETMAPQLQQLGYSMTDNPEQASLILVNTCGFLESAVEEALQSILESAQFKRTGACECLVVTGCMVQRYGKKLIELLPEVDLFLGTSHYHKLASSLESLETGDSRKLRIARPRHLITGSTPRVRSSTPGSAFIKIAEGCSNSCAFCLIPHLRGPYRSRSVEDVMREASRLAQEGIREINLIAQDTTAFGSDLGKNQALIPLLESLDNLAGLEWIRLLYAYPDRIEPILLRTMAQSRKVVDYLDIPIQHCAPKILSLMRRSISSTPMEDLIELIRFHLPNVTLRTSLMVGFPGETERDFEALLRFVQRIEFDHVGVFAFSPETGTRAAGMESQVDNETKAKRRDLLLEVQRSISRGRLERYIGQTLPVLIEGVHPETDLLLAGRLSTQAPEVDGTVIITRGTGQPGRITPARITAAHDYDVEGELLEE
jgi:ribosomal protein S12 methylthiotransferase